MKSLRNIFKKKNGLSFLKNDIVVQIYLSFVIMLTVSLVLTGFIFVYLYQRNYIRSYTSLLTKQGKKIASRVARFEASNKLQQFEKYSVYVDEIESGEQTDVWIVSNKKAETPLAQEYTNAEVGDDNLTEEMYAVLNNAFAGKVSSSSSYDKTYGMMILRVAVPIRDRETKNVIGSVMMISMIEKQTMGLREGNYLIVISAFLAILVSYAISLVFTRYLSRPINKIGKDINRIAEGDYSPIKKRSRSAQLGLLEDKLDLLSVQLAKSEEERENLEQVRMDFFANVSHELRTPITVMRGYAETLSDGIISNAGEIQEVYQRILAECRGMERLVEDLFILSKMQNPDFQIEREPVSLVQIFSDVERSAGEIGKEKEIELVLSVPEEEPCMILGDYVRLRQMFLIILDNAIKFSNVSGRIDVRMQRKDGRITVEIQDYGAGITEEELPYIFEKFYKSKMKQNEKGTGLGLMIARQIALRHGGDIQVDSKLQEGTIFSFSFEELTSFDGYE
ncbi:MAG: HAMP domain-containing histidine kinase [Lachnospiraceae bacterium]|nr:HAMP domain-containing histidine kinase [Lachnospiraceae bacterium]